MESGRKTSLLVACSLFAFVTVASASTLLDHIINEVDPCEDVCFKTYPSHTYEKRSTDSCCRGCRLYSIIELVGNEGGANGTLASCEHNCKEAYPNDEEGESACGLGCKSQRPASEKFGPMPTMDNMFGDERGLVGMISPLLYMHNMYSNIVDKVQQHMSVSWSFFLQDGTGRLVVIRSKPQMVDGGFDGEASLLRNSQGVEMSIGSDNPDVARNSQMKSVRSLGNDLNFAAKGDTWGNDNTASSDWLTCLAKRTGLPRLLLCLVILLSAVAMIWLCMSAAVTAPEQRVMQEKLSINGDLEYLRHMMEKKGIKAIHPQDFVEARPLPTKIRIHKL